VPSTGALNDAAQRFCALVDDLFYVEFAVDEVHGTVGVRVIAWDRDLTHQLAGPSRVPADQVDGLVTRVDDVIARATPSRYRAALRGVRDGRARPVSASVTEVSADAALDRRAVREGGGDPIEHVDLDRVAQMAQQQWPSAKVMRAADVTVRPYETNRVSFALDQHRSVDASVILHGEIVLGTLLGRQLHADNDERSVALTMAAIDDWLHLSLPGADILAQKRLTA
jgi:hypothetical protein